MEYNTHDDMKISMQSHLNLVHIISLLLQKFNPSGPILATFYGFRK